MRNRGLLLVLCGLVLVAAAAGCGKKLTVIQVPPFYHESLKAIAVVPFRSEADGGAAGRIVADELAAALQANGTYRVYNRSDLQALLNERDAMMAFSNDPAQAAAVLRKLGKVQAILVGSVVTYAAKSDKQFNRQPIYGQDRAGNTVVIGYDTFEVFFNSGVVSVSASLINVTDGSPVYATPAALTGRKSVEGRYVRYSELDCLTMARAEVVEQLLETFAIVRKQIKVDAAKALQTSSELFEGKWAKQDKFPVSAGKMFVVVNLPVQADRNSFRLGVIRQGERQLLWEASFTWSRANPARGVGFELSPQELAGKGGGPGPYVVKLYSGEEAVLERKFQITAR